MICRSTFLKNPRCKNHRYCEKEDCQRERIRRNNHRYRKNNPRDVQSDTHNVERVRQWRKRNPGYWRNKKGKSVAKTKTALQIESNPQSLDTEHEVDRIVVGAESALQIELVERSPVFIGLIGKICGIALQSEIDPMIGNLKKRGMEILGPRRVCSINSQQDNLHENTHTRTGTYSSGP